MQKGLAEMAAEQELTVQAYLSDAPYLAVAVAERFLIRQLQ